VDVAVGPDGVDVGSGVAVGAGLMIWPQPASVSTNNRTNKLYRRERGCASFGRISLFYSLLEAIDE
jgi:hypothetical protein